MEVPTIPETGMNEIILEQMVRYGNSIPSSTRDEYFKQITKNFQEWYKNILKCIQLNVSNRHLFLFHSEGRKRRRKTICTILSYQSSYNT